MIIGLNRKLQKAQTHTYFKHLLCVTKGLYFAAIQSPIAKVYLRPNGQRRQIKFGTFTTGNSSMHHDRQRHDRSRTGVSIRPRGS